MCDIYSLGRLKIKGNEHILYSRLYMCIYVFITLELSGNLALIVLQA